MQSSSGVNTTGLSSLRFGNKVENDGGSSQGCRCVLHVWEQGEQLLQLSPEVFRIFITVHILRSGHARRNGNREGCARQIEHTMEICNTSKFRSIALSLRGLEGHTAHNHSCCSRYSCFGDAKSEQARHGLVTGIPCAARIS